MRTAPAWEDLARRERANAGRAPIRAAADSSALLRPRGAGVLSGAVALLGLFALALLWSSAVTLPRAGLDVPSPPFLNMDLVSGGFFGEMRSRLMARDAKESNAPSEGAGGGSFGHDAKTKNSMADASAGLAPLWWLISDANDVLRHVAGVDLWSKRELWERRRDRATLALILPRGRVISHNGAGGAPNTESNADGIDPTGWSSARLQTHLRTRLGQLRRHSLAPSSRFIRKHLGIADRHSLVEAVNRIRAAERALAAVPWAFLCGEDDDSTSINEAERIRRKRVRDVRFLLTWVFLVVGGVISGLVVLRRWRHDEMSRRRENWGWGASLERPSRCWCSQ